MCVSFFSASAEKSVFKTPCLLRTTPWSMANAIAIVFVVATFAAARTVHAFYVLGQYSLLFWLMMLS